MAHRSKNRRHRRQLQLEKYSPQILAQKAASDFHRRHEYSRLPANFRSWEPPIHRIMEKLCPAGFALDAKLVTEDGWYCHDASMLTLDAADSTMILNRHLYAKQRKVDEKHVIELSINMKEAIDISFAITSDDWPVLVNGQHTLEAIILKDAPIRCKISVYQCRSQAAVAMLFKSFDDNKRRTKGQVIRAAVESNALISPISSTKLTFWAKKALPGMYGFSRNRMPKSNSSWVSHCARTDVQQFASFMERLREGVAQDRLNKIVPQGVGGAFFAMFLSHKEKASKFIRAYLQGEENGIGLLTHDPRQKLRCFLIEQSGKKGRHNDKLIPELAGRTYWSWKKWCSGEPVKLKTPIDSFDGEARNIPACHNWKIESVA